MDIHLERVLRVGTRSLPSISQTLFARFGVRHAFELVAPSKDGER